MSRPVHLLAYSYKGRSATYCGVKNPARADYVWNPRGQTRKGWKWKAKTSGKLLVTCPDCKVKAGLIGREDG